MIRALSDAMLYNRMRILFRIARFDILSIVKKEGIVMSETTTPQVTVYSTTWCAFCHTEMQWLDKLGIPYVAKDIEADKDAYEELMGKIGGNFQGVPVTDIAGEVVLGFDRPKIQNAIKDKNIEPVTA